MREDADASSVGDDSGIWDARARLRRQELITGKLQIKDATRDVEIKHLVTTVEEIRSAIMKVVWFIAANVMLTIGGILLVVIVWAIKMGATP